MFGAGEYLMVDFDLDKYEANKILLQWMQTYKEEDIWKKTFQEIK